MCVIGAWRPWMRILFLDIDGVICTDSSHRIKPKQPFPAGFHIPFRTGWDNLDKDCIKRLNRITDATGAIIIISSTWRLACLEEGDFQHLVDYLKKQGVTGHILDKTPTHLPHGYIDRINGRGKEIEQWLKDWSGEKIESFVILDDDYDLEPFLDHHVPSSEETGLDDEHIEQAIGILNGN